MKPHIVQTIIALGSAAVLVLGVVWWCVMVGDSAADSVGEQLKKAAERADFGAAKEILERGGAAGAKDAPRRRTGDAANVPEGQCFIPVYMYLLEPETRRLPNFNELKAADMCCTESVTLPLDASEGIANGVSLNRDWLGLRFVVKFRLAENEEGAYRFRIVTPHGARLIVSDKLVVQGESSGGLWEKSGQVSLKVGRHELFLDCWYAVGPPELQLFITPPGENERLFRVE
ncbi:MAG: hypothetical protein AB1646_10010 [Thermodesulfobacteriota bacterium]